MAGLADRWSEVIEAARAAQRAAEDCDKAREEETRSPGTCDPAKVAAAEQTYAAAKKRMLVLAAELDSAGPTLPAVPVSREPDDSPDDPEPWALTHTST